MQLERADGPGPRTRRHLVRDGENAGAVSPSISQKNAPSGLRGSTSKVKEGIREREKMLQNGIAEGSYEMESEQEKVKKKHF
jgi:hypothetical protein